MHVGLSGEKDSSFLSVEGRMFRHRRTLVTYRSTCPFSLGRPSKTRSRYPISEVVYLTRMNRDPSTDFVFCTVPATSTYRTTLRSVAQVARWTRLPSQ